jgi:hypothetical protein
MALPRQIVPVVFSGGLDQDKPAKLSVKGTFLLLENAIRRKFALVEKRFGFVKFRNVILGSSTTIDEGKTLTLFRNDLLLLNSQKAYSYTPASDGWISKGNIVNTLLDSVPVIRNAGIQATPDIAYGRNLTAACWEDSTGGVRCSVFDDETGSAVLSNQLMDASGTYGRVVALDNVFLFTYLSGANLVSRVVAYATPGTLGAANNVQAGNATTTYDIEVFDNNAVFAMNNTSNGLTIGYIAPTGIVGSPVGNGLPAVVHVVSATSLGKLAINVAIDRMNGYFYITYYDTTTDTNLRLRAYTSDLASTVVANVEALANVRNVTVTVKDDSSLIVYYEVSAASVKNQLIRQNTASWPGTGAITIGTPAVFKRSVGLATKAFTVGDHEYVGVAHESGLQPTYFVIRDDGFIISKMAQSVGGGLTRGTNGSLKTGLPRVTLNASGQYISAIRIRNQLQTDIGGTVLSTQIGINKFALGFDMASYRTDALGENLHVAGGIVQAYDGTAIAEHGFNLFPENVTTSASGADGSLTVSGSYTLRVTYEWVDGRGQIHKSAPSIANVQVAAASNHISVVIPTLRLTAKQSTVNCVVYVAAVGLSTVFYRHGVVANDATTDTVTYTILTEPVTTNEVLYTVGGTYENIASPAAQIVHEHLNRLWVGGLETDEIGYSQEFVNGEGVGFSDLFRIPMEAEGGTCKAFASLDEKLVIFKKARAYYLVGNGPLSSGAQNDYGRPQLIASDVGTELPESVVEGPSGIFFKSSKGFYLLSRRLEMVPIGKPVEDYNDLIVSSAVILEDENEVRFTTTAGVCLVYNYYYKQWSVFTNYESESAIAAVGSYLHLTSDGYVHSETPGEYQDNGQRITMALETSWLSMAGIQGFQRIYWFEVLGDFVSHHYSRCKLAYDFENAYNETNYFDTRTGLVSSSVYGEGATYGETTPYGGEGSTVYQFRLKPARQKCETIKIRLEDIDTQNVNGGGSFKLVAMTFEVGAKGGLYRLPPRKTIGSA